MENSDTQKASFQDRLARISGNSGQQMPEPDSLVADYEAHEAARAAKRPELTAEEAARALNPGILENIKYPLSFVRAFLIGAVVVFVIRLVRYHLFTDPGVQPDLEAIFFIDLLLAVGLGFVMKTFLSMREKELQFSQTVGVFVMITCMHNFYHWAPAPMSVIFSSEWTEEMRVYTVGNSVYFRGDYYVFYEDPDAQKPALPQTWSLG